MRWPGSSCQPGRDVLVLQFLGKLNFVLELEHLCRQVGAGFVELVLLSSPQNAVDRFVRRAIVLDQLDVLPRSVTYLAEVVRRGGLRYTLGLSEPLPAPSQAEIALSWLTAAEEVSDNIDSDRRMARWWDAVAAIIAMRWATSSGANDSGR